MRSSYLAGLPLARPVALAAARPAPQRPALLYKKLNETLDAAGFDAFCERRREAFYHARLVRPSLTPGTYFRLQLIGFFEGLGSERGIAWREWPIRCRSGAFSATGSTRRRRIT